MIKIEVDSKKKYMRDSFVVRANEPMRLSVNVTDTGHLIVYGYPGTEDDLEQDPVLIYDSENEANKNHEYSDEK